MKRVAAFAAFVVLAALALPAATAGAGTGSFGSFEVVCKYTHSAVEDPIVAPGVSPFGHRHDFFGNTTTGAFTTQAQLDAGPTTCDRIADASGYWAPSVIRADGSYDVPSLVHLYYQDHVGTLQPLPVGLKMIAGNSKATGPQSTKVVAWQCSDNLGPTTPQSTPPDCGPLRNIKLRVRFPDCWDGVNLDSPDHKSHMAYDVNDACPSGHPVPVPLISAEFKYGDLHNAADIAGLSSGSVLTGHADFWNGWVQSELANLVTNCSNVGVACKGSLF